MTKREIDLLKKAKQAIERLTPSGGRTPPIDKIYREISAYIFNAETPDKAA